MERKGPIHPQQGGGTGVGLKIPPQIYIEERQKFPAILSDLKCFMNNAKSQAELLLDQAHKSQRVRLGQKLQHLEVVEGCLLWRMFVLNQRKSDDIVRTATITSSFQNSRKLLVDQTTLRESHNRFQETVNINTPRTPAKPLKEVYKRYVGNRVTQPVTALQIPILQFIPGLPKVIEDVVQLWRKGDGGRFHPIYLFDTVDQRRKMIHGYSDLRWRQSGQKAAFYKLKKLVIIVAGAHGDLDVFEVHSEKWTQALSSYHKKYDRGGEPVPLSSFSLKERGG
ncbi:hypothetical protein FGB62_251g014 [Gracilaria domingensis]|nr:hypothetical protein FGB62_251g014 [Gracilaria domingensis]